MSKPNMYCGECPYWLAYGEPETTDEQNEAILAHCAEGDFDPEVEEARQEAHDNLVRSLVEAGGEIRELNDEKNRLIFALKEAVEWLDYFLTTERDDIYYDDANEVRCRAEYLLMELEG